MDRNYEAALIGRLESSGGTSGTGSFAIANRLCVPLELWWLEERGEQWGFERQGTAAASAPGHPLQPQATVTLAEAFDGYWFMLTTARSGAFAALAGPRSEPEASYTGREAVAIEAVDLVAPNALGLPPQSSEQRIVPGSSPRVLVGCGMAPSEAPGFAIAREQYWQLSSDSYSLVPSERRTVSFTETTGMESTTSTQETVAMALGMSVSAGWGPVSASVSASLSTSSTTFQQVTLSHETTSFVSREVENRSEAVELVLVWQLVEVVTIFELDGIPLASTISSLNPAIVQSGKLPRPSAGLTTEPPARPLPAPRIVPQSGAGRP